jgi:hypothetical protein
VAEYLDAALAYAAGGWPVFPCVVDGKEPTTPHGFKDATTDPAQITTWWRRSPRANIAVATGAPGPDVIDVDVKGGRDGMALFDRACEAGLMRGAAAIVRTPSGGFHVWFEGTDQRGGAVGESRALELKARGGYVLVPPSFVEDEKHGYAGQYELIERRDGAASTVDFRAVRSLFTVTPGRFAHSHSVGTTFGGIAPLVAFLGRQPEGNRNKALYWASCTALENGCTDTDLEPLYDAAVAIGLTDHETRRTLASACAEFGGLA